MWFQFPHIHSSTYWFFGVFLVFVFFVQYMEVPRLGGELELQLPAYTTATAKWDLSHICDPHHSSWHQQILNPLSEDRY